VLDRACAQFDPDDPEYISVTRKTYDFVDENTKYTSLRPTRHFGPMVLHLVLSKKMDNLLFHFINSKDIDAAANLVRLFHTVADDTSPTEVDEFQLIEVFPEMQFRLRFCPDYARLLIVIEHHFHHFRIISKDRLSRNRR
jgi:small subunit ribosomal protein S22